MAAVHTQIVALNVAHNHFEADEMRALKQKLAETTLELERARMSSEDVRGAMVSPYSTHVHTADPPRRRSLSWREFATDRNEMCDHLVYNVMDPAKEVLVEARQELSKVRRDPPSSREAALTAAEVAYNAICKAEKCL